MDVIQEAEQIAKQEIPVQQKLDKKILSGKKVMLFEFDPNDLPHFVKLHREDEKGYMGKYCLKKMSEIQAGQFVAHGLVNGLIKIWSVYLKNNSFKNIVDGKRAGFIYIDNFTPFSVEMSGIMDNHMMRGLIKYIRRDTYTFAEDAMRTLIQHCFDCGLNRIETSIFGNNRRGIALNKKCGFKQEGVLRQSFQMDGKFYDTVLLSILKDEWGNGKK